MKKTVSKTTDTKKKEKEDSSCVKAINAGVHGATGLEFQKHCALYFLLDKYKELKHTKYFICLEHHDDILFCYLTEDKHVSSIDAYQAKKSSNNWTLGNEMFVIILKLAQVGISLKQDAIPKINTYSHNLHFVTNNSIVLNSSRKKDKVQNIINESNNKLKYVEFNREVCQKIERKIEKLADENANEIIKELNNLHMEFIDLPKSCLGQKDCLVGKFNRIFGDLVNDPKAAVDTLIQLFRNVEVTLNQGNNAKLMDKSKRVESDDINNAIAIITTKKMAFEYWRNEKKDICKKLGIGILDHKGFENDFNNCFDRFKDLKEVEHNKIKNFVHENCDLSFSDEIECINDLYKKFKENVSTTLSDLNIKAAIYAAYIELREEIWEQN